jgi:hypothetical protein
LNQNLNTFINSYSNSSPKTKTIIQNDGKYFELLDENCNVKENDSTTLRKIDQITRGQKPYLKRVLLDILDRSPQNAEYICDFVIAERNEINIQESTTEWHVKVLGQIQKFIGFKDFNLITKEDILNYLDSLRRTKEEDPTNKSIGNRNNKQ